MECSQTELCGAIINRSPNGRISRVLSRAAVAANILQDFGKKYQSILIMEDS